MESAKARVNQASPESGPRISRRLSYQCDRLGNLTLLRAGVLIGYAGTGNASPNAATSATLDSARTISYDTSGHATRYDAATGDDTFIEWDGRGDGHHLHALALVKGVPCRRLRAGGGRWPRKPRLGGCQCRSKIPHFLGFA